MSSPAKPKTFLARVMRHKWLVLLGTLVVLFLVVSLLGGYFGRWGWVGVTARTVPTVKDRTYVPPKTLWDWLQLLIIPAALAAAGYWFTTQQRQRDAEAAERQHRDDADLVLDKQREDLLATYFDRVSDLLLKGELHQMPIGSTQGRGPAVAHARTLTTLRRLDAERKASLVKFLYESGLITGDTPIINLSGADLEEADLRWTDLRGAHLRGAFLKGAHLKGAHLEEAHLEGVVLRGAHLRWVVLKGAHLEGAHLEGAVLKGDHLEGDRLEGADLTRADLRGAHLEGADLRGADLREADPTGADLDGTKYNKQELDGLRATQWPEGFDPDKAGAKAVD